MNQMYCIQQLRTAMMIFFSLDNLICLTLFRPIMSYID